jgi:hypothetical protein
MNTRAWVQVTVYGHEGEWGGFHTACYRHTNSDRAIVLLSNRGGFDVSKTWDAIDAVFEKAP